MTTPLETRSFTRVQRVLIYIAATGLAALALRCLSVFVFTDYRSHHRPVIIPVAIASLALATGLFRLWSPAVLCSLGVASVLAGIAVYVQCLIVSVQPFLATVVVACVAYVTALLPRYAKSA